VIEILFVDDEPSLLAGLRRMLYSMRSEWSMRFVGSAPEALEMLREHPADVVVSDMRMPVMDGATFLTHVREEFPDTVRIILSGYTEFASALRSVPVAHQFLNKPCDSAMLKTAVQRSCELQQRLMSTGLRRLVGAVGALPSPPHILENLNRCLASNEPSIDEVAKVISGDIAMTAKLLQLANSAFFGLAREVREVSQAIAYLGLATVRDLATAAEAFRSFTSTDPDIVSWVTELEAHSADVATIASQLTDDRDRAMDAYSAGLLHDIGNLVLATTATDKFRSLRASTAGDPIGNERELLGATHADLGAYLLTLWGLPYGLVDAVAHSHDASDQPWEMSVTHAVHVAEAISEERAGGPVTSPKALDPNYLEALGISSLVAELRATSG